MASGKMQKWQCLVLSCGIQGMTGRWGGGQRGLGLDGRIRPYSGQARQATAMCLNGEGKGIEWSKR